MNTVFLLMAKYDGRPLIDTETVCHDFFPHLKPEAFLRKVSTGDIHLPLVRMDGSSQKTAKGIHINDLATYIERRREEAAEELRKMTGRRF